MAFSPFFVQQKKETPIGISLVAKYLKICKKID